MQEKEKLDPTIVGKQKKKLGKTLRDNLQKIIIIAVSLLYISQGLFQIRQKNTTLWDVLGNIGLSIIVGIVIYENLRSMGIKDGRQSEEFKNSLTAYGNAKAEATEYFDKLPAWCEYKNVWEIELKKKDIIQAAGLKWKAYKLGYYDEHQEKLSEDQIKALKAAKECKIYRLTTQELLSDLPKNKTRDNNRFGETQREYMNKNGIIDTLGKIALGVVSGLYGLSPLLTKDNVQEVVGGMIWNASQIILWVSLGLVKYSEARSFIIDEYRQTHIIQKTELLTEFRITMSKNPDAINKYDEDEEFDKYIEEYIKAKENKKDEETNVLV